MLQGAQRQSGNKLSRVPADCDLEVQSSRSIVSSLPSRFRVRREAGSFAADCIAEPSASPAVTRIAHPCISVYYLATEIRSMEMKNRALLAAAAAFLAVCTAVPLIAHHS